MSCVNLTFLLTVHVVVHIYDPGLFCLGLPQAVCDAHQVCTGEATHLHFIAAILVDLEFGLGWGHDNSIVSFKKEAHILFTGHAGKVEAGMGGAQDIGYQGYI